MDKEQMEEIKRHFGVVAEGLEDNIHLVAEGHEVIRHEIQAMRKEKEQAHREILSAIKFSYAERDHRVQTLEGSVLSLQTRMERLEMQQQ